MSINELNKEYFRPWGSYICLDQGIRLSGKTSKCHSGRHLVFTKTF